MKRSADEKERAEGDVRTAESHTIAALPLQAEVRADQKRSISALDTERLPSAAPPPSEPSDPMHVDANEPADESNKNDDLAPASVLLELAARDQRIRLLEAELDRYVNEAQVLRARVLTGEALLKRLLDVHVTEVQDYLGIPHVLISVAVSSGSAQEYRERRFSPIVATRVAPSFPLGPNFQVLGRTIDSGELPKLKASEKPQRRPSRGREAVEKKHEDDYGTGKEKSERKREEKAVQKERATEPDRTKAAVAEIGLVWGDTEGMNDVLHKKSRETVGRIDGENNGYEGSPKKVQENSTSSNPLMVRLPNWAYNSNNVPSKQPEKLELPEAENVKEIERDISKEKDHEEEEDLSEERMVGFEIAGEPGASALEGDLEATRAEARLALKPVNFDISQDEIDRCLELTEVKEILDSRTGRLVTDTARQELIHWLLSNMVQSDVKSNLFAYTYRLDQNFLHRFPQKVIADVFQVLKKNNMLRPGSFDQPSRLRERTPGSYKM